jgi:hypothetical protein
MAHRMVSNSRKPRLAVGFVIVSGLFASGQTPGPLGYSVATPRPINPAEGTTNPSAQATQNQNPYLGQRALQKHRHQDRAVTEGRP